MGTVIDKLRWLINKKKELINIINSKTSYNNTTGLSTPFTSKYSSASSSFTNIVKEAACLYPMDNGEVIMSRMYTGSTLVSGMTNYLRPGVTFSISTEATGIYNCSISRPADLEYFSYYVHVVGSHADSNYNSPVFASVLYTNSTSSGSTTFKIYTADDDSLNNGTFTIIVYAVG